MSGPIDDEMEFPSDHQAAASIVESVCEEFGLDSPAQATLDSFAAEIGKIRHEVRSNHIEQSVPSDKQVDRELDAFRNTLHRLSSLSKGGEPAKNRARQILIGAHIVNDVGDTISIDHWLDVSIKVNDAFAALIDKGDYKDEFDWGSLYSRRPAGPYEWPTELMGYILPKEFEALFPNASFGSKKDGDRPLGAGYSFVCKTMESVGYDPVTNQAVFSALDTVKKKRCIQ